jgi:hypothetical protein
MIRRSDDPVERSKNERTGGRVPAECTFWFGRLFGLMGLDVCMRSDRSTLRMRQSRCFTQVHKLSERERLGFHYRAKMHPRPDVKANAE